MISNGKIDKGILNVIDGKQIGTFFTNIPSQSLPVDVQAVKGEIVRGLGFHEETLFNSVARDGSRLLQKLSAAQRQAIINKMASNLTDYSKDILRANTLDLDEANRRGSKGYRYFSVLHECSLKV